MYLLLVEDDQKIANFLREGLIRNGYTVDLAKDGEVAEFSLRSNKYDLLILDVMLPKKDGLSIVQEFRKKDQKTPVLFLSAKRSVDDRVLGLQTGGDDYLTKPFSLSELLARVQALLRRSSIMENIGSSNSTLLVGGSITLDLISREVKRDGLKIELQLKELSLLEYFLRNQNVVLNKTQILEYVWNYRFDPQTNGSGCTCLSSSH